MGKSSAPWEARGVLFRKASLSPGALRTAACEYPRGGFVMREFVKSCLSLGVATSLFPLKQLENMITPTQRGEYKGPATKAMDAVVNATVDQFGGTLRSTFSAIDNMQRGLVGMGFDMLWPFGNRSRTARADRREADREYVEQSAETWWPRTGRSEQATYRAEPGTRTRTQSFTSEPLRRRGNGEVGSGRRA